MSIKFSCVTLRHMSFIVRIVSCFFCGIAAGLLLHLFFRGKAFFKFDGFDEPPSHDTDPNLFLRLAKNIGRNIRATGLYFLFGIFLSAVFQRYVPEDFMTAFFGGNEAFGVLMAATIGVPFYDTAIIGYPRWWYALPLVMDSFFDEYDFSGKTLIPFDVHNGSRLSDTVETIQELEPDARVITDGFTISQSTVAEETESVAEEVSSWLQGLRN